MTSPSTHLILTSTIDIYLVICIIPIEKLRVKSLNFQWAMQLVGMVEQSFETRYAGSNTQMHHRGNIQLHPALFYTYR